MPNRTNDPELDRIRCKECGAFPQAYWHTEAETVALVCTCGERLVPGDAILEHDLMPDDVSWTVEGDGGEI